MEFPQMLPSILIVVVGGWLWWGQRKCCAKLDKVIDWIKNGGTKPDGTDYSSVDEWIQAVHVAICQIEDNIVNGTVIDGAKALCESGPTDPTDPPRSPPPF